MIMDAMERVCSSVGIGIIPVENHVRNQATAGARTCGPRAAALPPATIVDVFDISPLPSRDHGT
jgi:hypothetical protein